MDGSLWGLLFSGQACLNGGILRCHYSAKLVCASTRQSQWWNGVMLYLVQVPGTVMGWQRLYRYTYKHQSLTWFISSKSFGRRTKNKTSSAPSSPPLLEKSCHPRPVLILWFKFDGTYRWAFELNLLALFSYTISVVGSKSKLPLNSVTVG